MANSNSSIDFGIAPTVQVPATGKAAIDGILWDEKFADPQLTYSFTDSASDYSGSYDWSVPVENAAGQEIDTQVVTGFSALDAKQQAAVAYWLDQFAAVSGLTFRELDGAAGTATEDQEANLRFANSSIIHTAQGGLPGYLGAEETGDVWFGGTGDDPDFGDFDFATVGHEIGHAIGLAHGHSSSGHDILPDALDSSEYSIMTYMSHEEHDLDADDHAIAGPWSNPQTLMAGDIRAVQSLYGANYDHNDGDTVYAFHPLLGQVTVDGVAGSMTLDGTIFATIWDGGGEDTYDLSGYFTPLDVDLAPGAGSTFATGQLADLGVGADDTGAGEVLADANVYNAYLHDGDTRALIENVIGGFSHDRIDGNEADNVLRGGTGNDRLSGKAGDDRLYGDGGDDTLFGGDGDDYLNGGFGFDELDGGRGHDTMDGSFYDGDWDYDMASGLVRWGSSIERAIDFEVALTGAGDDRISGTNRDDTIETGSGDDTVHAGSGDDYVNGGFGFDHLDGGLGRDTMDGSFYGGDWDYDMASGLVRWGSSTETALNFEVALTAAGDDRIAGTRGADTIGTAGGDDVAFGRGGDDTILTGEGADQADGGEGDDTIDTGRGHDTVQGGAGDDRIQGGRGRDEMDGGAGYDTLVTTEFNGTYEVDLATGETNWAGETALNFEAVETGNGRDRVVGTDGANRILTNGGDDVVDGGAGDDTIRAGAGDDRVDGGWGFDDVDGGAGFDTMDGTFYDGAWDFDMASGVIDWGSRTERAVNFEAAETGNGHDRVVGTDGANRILANGGDDTVDGGAGADEMDGGAGYDWLIATGRTGYQIEMSTGVTGIAGETALNFEAIRTGAGDDRVLGNDADNVIVSGAGGDTLFGGTGQDTLDAGAGDDILAGGVGDDLLSGGAGADLLSGHAGDDVMSGGAGADRFSFFDREEGDDRITDFEIGIDVLSFERGAADGFAALEIADLDAGAHIGFGNGSLLLEGLAAADLGEDSFMFVG